MTAPDFTAELDGLRRLVEALTNRVMDVAEQADARWKETATLSALAHLSDRLVHVEALTLAHDGAIARLDSAVPRCACGTTWNPACPVHLAVDTGRRSPIGTPIVVRADTPTSDLESQLREARAEVARLTKERDDEKRRADSLGRIGRDLETDIERAWRERDAARVEVDRLRDLVGHLTAERDFRRAARKQQCATLDALRAEVDRLTRERDAARSTPVGEWKPLTRGEAIELGRHCASAKPQSYYSGSDFMPHEWVIDAIIAASRHYRMGEATPGETATVSASLAEIRKATR